MSVNGLKIGRPLPLLKKETPSASSVSLPLKSSSSSSHSHPYFTSSKTKAPAAPVMPQLNNSSSSIPATNRPRLVVVTTSLPSHSATVNPTSEPQAPNVVAHDDNPTAPPAISITIQLEQLGGSAIEELESIRSNEPSPSSSQVSLVTPSQFDLHAAYPSVAMIAKQLRQSAYAEDIRALGTLATVFDTSLKSVVDSLECLPQDVCFDSRFTKMKYTVMISSAMFVARVAGIEPATTGVTGRKSIFRLLEYMNVALSSLEQLLSLARDLTMAAKPLPKLPQTSSEGKITTPGKDTTKLIGDTTVVKSSARNAKDVIPFEGDARIASEAALREPSIKLNTRRESLLDLVTEVVEEDSRPMAASPQAMEEENTLDGIELAGGLTDEEFVTSVPRRAKKRIIARLLASVTSKSKDSFFRHMRKTQSSLSLTPSSQSIPSSSSVTTLTTSTGTLSSTSSGNTSPVQSFESSEKSKPVEQPYIIRESAYVLADPDIPGESIRLPLPSGPEHDIRLDGNGVMKTATLPAIIRHLTSKGGTLDADFLDTFFLCFRYFSTPEKVFNAFMARYYAEPPQDLTVEQLYAWTHDSAAVRIRVVKVLIKWTQDYWRPDSDRVIHKKMVAFAFNILYQQIPEPVAMKLMAALARLAEMADKPQYSRTLETRRGQEYMRLKNKVPEPNPSGYNASLYTYTQDSFLAACDFDSASGYDELARQLTLYMSKLFGGVVPEDAVLFWHEGKDMSIGEKISTIISAESGVSFWVSDSILLEATPIGRAQKIGFWTNVALTCVDYRNYSSAFAIYSGLARRCIDRLKHTIIEVKDEHKRQYQRLNNMFSGYANMTEYRKSISESDLPAIPLIICLIHDIRAVEGVIDLMDDSKIINLAHYRTIAKTIRVMELCQIPYKFDRIESVLEMLNGTILKYNRDTQGAIMANLDNNSGKCEQRDPALKVHSDYLWKTRSMIASYTPDHLDTYAASVAESKKSYRLRAPSLSSILTKISPTRT